MPAEVRTMRGFPAALAVATTMSAQATLVGIVIHAHDAGTRLAQPDVANSRLRKSKCNVLARRPTLADEN